MSLSSSRVLPSLSVKPIAPRNASASNTLHAQHRHDQADWVLRVRRIVSVGLRVLIQRGTMAARLRRLPGLCSLILPSVRSTTAWHALRHWLLVRVACPSHCPCSASPLGAKMAFIERGREQLSSIVYTGVRKGTSVVCGHVPLAPDVCNVRHDLYQPLGIFFEPNACL